MIRLAHSKNKESFHTILVLGVVAIGLLLSQGCQNLRLPRIDPYGERIFLPADSQGTAPRQGLLSGCLSKSPNSPQFPVMTGDPNLAVQPGLSGQPFIIGTGVNPSAQLPATAPVSLPPTAMQPMVSIPYLPPPTAKARPCEHQGALGSCLDLRREAKKLGVPAQNPYKLLHQGRRGELLLTPSKIVAPVGSEVLVLTGICGADGHFVTGQPVEITLSQDSVGQIIDYQGRPANRFAAILPAKATKNSGDYLTLTTSRKEETVNRGTPTRIDDVHVEKGQSWISLSSASPGNSYITAIAPNAEAWDKRLKSMEIQWVDALWTLPTPATATAGARYPLITNIRQIQDGLGIGNWKVRYQIAGGAPAQFLPAGSQSAEVITGPDGNASVEIQQSPDQPGPGTTFVRVDIIRPASNASGYEVIESGVTSIRWSSPALTIRAIGPRTVAIGTPFNYRLEVTNPGDQVARESVITLESLPQGLSFVSSNPKPAEYGNRLVWSSGDIPPGAAPNVVDIQFKSDDAVGTARLCFEVASAVDQLRTQACAETQIVAPKLGIKIDGNRQGRVGEVTRFLLTFVNQSNEPLRGLTAQVLLQSSGIEVAGKSGPVTFGPMSTPLAFGESRTLDLDIYLREEGEHSFIVMAQAEGGISGSIRRNVTASQVNQPSIALQLSSDGAAVYSQEHRVVARVTNTGNVPLTGVRLRTENSASLQPIGASANAYEENGLVIIPLDRLEPTSYRDIVIGYQGIALDGNGFARFQVLCDQGVEDLKEVTVPVISGGEGVGGVVPSTPTLPGGSEIGVPGSGAPGRSPGMLAVQMATATPLVRRQNPFDVEIAVTNQRSQSDRTVQIVLQTPPGVQFQGVLGGATGVLSSPDGMQHAFTTIQELRSGETIRLTVRLLPVQTGSPRLEVTALSESTAVPNSQTLDITITP